MKGSSMDVSVDVSVDVSGGRDRNDEAFPRERETKITGRCGGHGGAEMRFEAGEADAAGQGAGVVESVVDAVVGAELVEEGVLQGEVERGEPGAARGSRSRR